MSERDPRLAQIVRRNFHVYSITNTDTDKILAHLPRDVGEDLVAIGEGDTKHRPRQHLRYRPL